MVEEGDSKAELVYMDQNMEVQVVLEVVRKHKVAVDLVDDGDVVAEAVQHSSQDVVAEAVHHTSVVMVQKGLVVAAAGAVQKGLVVVGRVGAYGMPLLW